jgi:hypothetical protein
MAIGLALSALAMTAAAQTDDNGIDIEIRNIVQSAETPGLSQIMLAVTRTRDEPATFVEIHCTAMDPAGTEVATGELRIQGLPARQTREEPMDILYDGLIAGASCNLVKYIP